VSVQLVVEEHTVGGFVFSKLMQDKGINNGANWGTCKLSENDKRDQRFKRGRKDEGRSKKG